MASPAKTSAQSLKALFEVMMMALLFRTLGDHLVEEAGLGVVQLQGTYLLNNQERGVSPAGVI